MTCAIEDGEQLLSQWVTGWNGLEQGIEVSLSLVRFVLAVALTINQGLLQAPVASDGTLKVVLAGWLREMIRQGRAPAKQGCGCPVKKSQQLRLVVASGFDEGLHLWLLNLTQGGHSFAQQPGGGGWVPDFATALIH